LLFGKTNYGATLTFVGEGGKAREHKTSLHAIRSIMRNEGFIGMYTG